MNSNRKSEEDFNILVLGLVLIAISLASYAAQVYAVLKARRNTPDHVERYAYTMNIVPEYQPRPREKILVVFYSPKNYLYCKETKWNP